MKQYMVFAYSEYYPLGGLTDCDSDYDDREEAIARAKKINKDCVYVWDRFNDKNVWENA